MPEFSFTEKEWDKIRPSSIKKTGVSDAIRSVLKGIPKDLKALRDGDACDAAVGLLVELDKALDKADGMLKPKDDKHDAAGRIKTWKAEVRDGRAMIGAHRDKLLLALAQAGANAKMAGLLEEVEAAVEQSKKLAAEIAKQLKAGAKVDLPELNKTQQGFRDTQRMAAKAVTKGGFLDFVRFLDEVHKSGIDPAKLEIPDTAKRIKASIDTLETNVDLLGDVLNKAVELQSAVTDQGELADAARDLIDDYKQSIRELKKYAALGKKLEAQAKPIADAIKATNVTETGKLLALAQKLHEVENDLEDKSLKEAYRSRNSKGDIQAKYSKLAKEPGWDKYNDAIRDWRAAIFDVVRTCTVPASYVKNQIDRAIKVLIEMGGTTAAQAETLEKRIDQERNALKMKYGAGG